MTTPDDFELDPVDAMAIESVQGDLLDHDFDGPDDEYGFYDEGPHGDTWGEHRGER